MGRARNDITDEQIAEALAKHGNRRRHAAGELHCSESRVAAYCIRNDIPAPVRRHKSVDSYLPKITWDTGNLTRLRAAYMRNPRPSVAEMASEFGTTPAAIQTILSRAGLTRVPAMKAERMVRKCLCCPNLILSEGSGHRQCHACFEENSRIAA